MKLLKRLFLFLIVLVVAAGVGLYYVDSLAKGAIEKGGKYAAGVETTVGAANVGLMNGTFTLADFAMANPPGYDAAPFFALKRLETGVSLPTLRQDVVELPKLEIDGVRLRLLAKEGKANYAVITENLKRFSSTSSASEEKSGKKFVIRELIVRDVSVVADLALLVPLPVGAKPEIALPEIRMKDVGSAGGAGSSLSELAGVVVAAVLNAVGGAGNFLNADFAKDLTGRLGDLGALQQQALGAVNAAVGGALQDVGSKVGGEAQKALDKVGQGLGGLLGGKK